MDAGGPCSCAQSAWADLCAHTYLWRLARGAYIPGFAGQGFSGNPEQTVAVAKDKALDSDGVRSSAEVCLVTDAIRNDDTLSTITPASCDRRQPRT